MVFQIFLFFKIIFFSNFKIFINHLIFSNIFIWNYRSFKFIVKNLDRNFFVVKYKEWYFKFSYFSKLFFLNFKIFINNLIFCNILVWKYRSFKFIVIDLDRNFFGC